MAGPTLSTHVLDTGTGRPAAGVTVSVYRGDDLLAFGKTNVEGRIKDLAPGALTEGTHRLVFEVGAYFAEAEPSFFRRVALDIELAATGPHHVPLLISRHGLVSYRGS